MYQWSLFAGVLPLFFPTYYQYLLCLACSALLLLQSWLKWLALVLKNWAPHLSAGTGFHLLFAGHKRYCVKYMICFIFCRFLSWPWHCHIWVPSTTALSKGLIWILCVGAQPSSSFICSTALCSTKSAAKFACSEHVCDVLLHCTAVLTNDCFAFPSKPFLCHRV